MAEPALRLDAPHQPACCCTACDEVIDARDGLDAAPVCVCCGETDCACEITEATWTDPESGTWSGVGCLTHGVEV